MEYVVGAEIPLLGFAHRFLASIIVPARKEWSVSKKFYMLYLTYYFYK